MLVVGLTGSIGSGKSTVAELFAASHVPIIDADIIAAQLSTQDAIKQAIHAYFGHSVFDQHGNIHRQQLRAKIFSAPRDKIWLEQLLQPLILNAIAAQIRNLTAAYCVVVMPLLIETGPHPFLDHILVVDTPSSVCIQRAAIRDNSSSAAIQQIITTQATASQRLTQATEVISNNGSKTALIAKVQQLHQYYLKISNASPQ